MASVPPKKTELLKLYVDERLYVDLNRLAVLDDRKLTEYVYLILWRHANGNSSRVLPEEEGPQ